MLFMFVTVEFVLIIAVLCVMEDEFYATPSWNDLPGIKDFYARSFAGQRRC